MSAINNLDKSKSKISVALDAEAKTLEEKIDRILEKTHWLKSTLKEAAELADILAEGKTEKLNIHDAVKKAIETGGYITGSRFNEKLFIEPTDTPKCCILHADKNHSCQKWNPSASDLMSENWKVVTKEEFLALSEQNNIF